MKAKSFRIMKVEVLNDLSAVLITVQGYKEKIYRTAGQFLAELRGSNLIQHNVSTLSHPILPSVLRGLQGGIVHGALEYNKAGTTYVIEAEHPALTDPNHRLFGQVVEGEEVARESNGFYIERGNLLSYKATPQFEERMDSIVIRVAMENEIKNDFNALMQMDDTTEELPTVAPEDAFDEFEVTEDTKEEETPTVEEPKAKSTSKAKTTAKEKAESK